MSIKITCKKNGPYRVEGDLSQLELVDADGNKYDLTGKPGISLCRCGGSVNRHSCSFVTGSGLSSLAIVYVLSP